MQKNTYLTIKLLKPATKKFKIESKILYFSDFEININDWLNNYENIEIFKMYLNRQLITKSDNDWNCKVKKCLIFPIYSRKDPFNLAIERFLGKNYSVSNQKYFEIDFMEYLKSNKYVISDSKLMSELVQEFLVNALSVKDRMSKKIVNDNNFDFSVKEKEYESIIKSIEKRELSSDKASGYMMLKNRIICPLILTEATEIEKNESFINLKEERKLVPNLINHYESRSKQKFFNPKVIENSILKKRYMKMKKLNNNPGLLLSKKAITLICSSVDLSFRESSHEPIVVKDFVILVIEIPPDTMNKILLKANEEILQENLSMRIMKPFKQFYSYLIESSLIYGLQHILDLEEDLYVETVKSLMENLWNERMTKPTKSFLKLCKIELEKHKASYPNNYYNLIFLLFDNLKCKLMHLWNWEIVERANEFKKFKVEI